MRRINANRATLSYRQENVLVHSRTQRYQAIPLPAEEENIFNISTAKKSRVVPQSVCSSCGARVAKQQAQGCPSCGAELCSICYQHIQEQFETDREDDE